MIAHLPKDCPVVSESKDYEVTIYSNGTFEVRCTVLHSLYHRTFAGSSDHSRLFNCSSPVAEIIVPKCEVPGIYYLYVSLFIVGGLTLLTFVAVWCVYGGWHEISYQANAFWNCRIRECLGMCCLSLRQLCWKLLPTCCRNRNRGMDIYASSERKRPVRPPLYSVPAEPQHKW